MTKDAQVKCWTLIVFVSRHLVFYHPWISNMFLSTMAIYFVLYNTTAVSMIWHVTYFVGTSSGTCHSDNFRYLPGGIMRA